MKKKNCLNHVHYQLLPDLKSHFTKILPVLWNWAPYYFSSIIVNGSQLPLNFQQ